MKDPELVRHVLDHYIARDRFRAAWLDYEQRQNGLSAMRTRILLHSRGGGWAMTHQLVTAAGIREKEAIHIERMKLMRLKRATLEHLHLLLHNEPVLDEDEHFHIDDDTFRYIIREM